MSRNSILREALELLRARLPKGWRLETPGQATRPSGADAELRLVSPERRSALLRVDVRSSLTPRAALDLSSRRAAGDRADLIVVPYLSPAVRERLREAELSYLDLTGNARLVVAGPGLFIETDGASTNPDPVPAAKRSLRGATAGRIVRALLDTRQPPGVRELAARSRANPGYVSRLLAWMDREALVERRGRGLLVAVDWQRVLRRWAEDAPLESRGSQTFVLAPRGLPDLLKRLAPFRGRYALTGSLAASVLAPVAPAKLATLYVDGPEQALDELDLRVAETGANALLIEPVDPVAYDGARRVDGLTYVAVSQAAADLLTAPGRGPAEGEALITWMAQHEESWRG